MFNLIMLEFYKLRKQRVLKILLLSVIIISALSAFSGMRILEANGNIITGKESYANAFLDIFMLFISAIFTGFYIGSDFSNKTIQAQLSNGHSRQDILISKAFTFFIATSLIMILYPLTVCIINILNYGWGEPFTATSLIYIFRVAILGVLLNIGSTSIFIFFAFICRDIPKTICVCIAFPVLFSALNSTVGNIFPPLGNILAFSTFAQLKNIVNDLIIPQSILIALLSACVTTTIMLTLGNLVFSRAEIK